MEIREYSSYQAEEVFGLYSAVSWTNYTDHPDMLENAFRNSLLILGVYDGAKLIGILRAVGDGSSVLLIQDILVHPAYQRQGIGTALMHEIMVRFPSVYQMQLVTDNTPETAAFYESLGFTVLEKMNCCGFMRVNI